MLSPPVAAADFQRLGQLVPLAQPGNGPPANSKKAFQVFDCQQRL